MPIWTYIRAMARAATTSDAFNAVAEPQRRRILVLLKRRERPVNELARALRITQPRTSKHLRVLREVGLVRVREAGQQRLYGLDARGLQPVHQWVWKEIVAPERIVWMYSLKKDDPNPVKTTLTLAERGNTAEATLQLVFGSKEERDQKVAKFYAAQGAQQTLDSLAAYVTSAQAAHK